MDGILNIYKESGYTSHDVVAKLRGILRQKKIGHTGTLDPAACGVLPVCLGNATKACEFLENRTKTYRAVLLLGRVTDTQDDTGSILYEQEADVSEEEVRSCIAGFVGTIRQIPPMYSARKVGGKKLYELARKGLEIEREAREITIYSIDIEEIRLPEVVFSVTCSKGTYIRTLCHDIGRTLKCGGCMKSLLRTRVGDFSLDDALRLSEVEALRDSGQLSDFILSTDRVFSGYPEIRMIPSADRLLANGNPFSWNCVESSPAGRENIKVPECFRVYNSSGKFCALYRSDDHRALLRPVKMFL